MRIKIAWGFNILFALLMVVSAFSRYIDPVVFWPAAFLGFSFPGLLLVNILFLIFWIWKEKKKTWLTILSIILCYQSILNVFSFSMINSNVPENENGIKVMSWNVRLFDLYNWSNNVETKTKMFEFLNDQQPDVLCLQEFYHNNIPSSYFITKDSLLEFLKTTYIHEEYTNDLAKTHFFGSATISKYPIVNRGKIEFGDAPSNICLFTDVLLKEDTIRIYNLHLASIRLSNQDHSFINDIGNAENTNKLKEGGGKILGRMKNAFIIRSKQVKAIEEAISNCPHEYVLVGDFNDTPNSYAYQKLSKGLSDAHKVSDFGIGGTYNGFASLFRIDYMFNSSGIQSSDFEVYKVPYSDHFPVSTVFYLKN